MRVKGPKFSNIRDTEYSSFPYIQLLVVSGKTNKGVARCLDISDRTVEIHRSNVIAKTQSTSLAELVKIAPTLDPD